MAAPRSPLSINLGDEGVRRMLGVPAPGTLATGKRDLVHVAGDVPDPTDPTSDARGVAATMRLDAGAIGHPLVVYKTSILMLDVYEIEGEPMRIALICPRCHHALSVTADRKRIEFDRVLGALKPSRRDEERIAAQMTTPTTRPSRHDLQAFGKISIEPFECTWEMTAERSEFGTTLCRWKVAIDDNIAKDA